MACAANYAWANRQMIMHLTEGALLHALRISPKDLNLRLVYDVAHNIAKLETHRRRYGSRHLCASQGATRALRAGSLEVPEDYREVGRPVLIPGDMGTASFV
jgi:tRNA-splicing ligase RtcB